jgi:hypothetical protein
MARDYAMYLRTESAFPKLDLSDESEGESSSLSRRESRHKHKRKKEKESKRARKEKKKKKRRRSDEREEDGEIHSNDEGEGAESGEETADDRWRMSSRQESPLPPPPLPAPRSSYRRSPPPPHRSSYRRSRSPPRPPSRDRYSNAGPSRSIRARPSWLSLSPPCRLLAVLIEIVRLIQLTQMTFYKWNTTLRPSSFPPSRLEGGLGEVDLFDVTDSSSTNRTGGLQTEVMDTCGTGDEMKAWHEEMTPRISEADDAGSVKVVIRDRIGGSRRSWLGRGWSDGGRGWGF